MTYSLPRNPCLLAPPRPTDQSQTSCTSNRGLRKCSRTLHRLRLSFRRHCRLIFVDALQQGAYLASSSACLTVYQHALKSPRASTAQGPRFCGQARRVLHWASSDPRLSSGTMPAKSRFTRLDAFTKTVEDARIRTTSGGVVTIASLLVVFYLILAEWRDYRRVVVQPELIVDKGRGKDRLSGATGKAES